MLISGSVPAVATLSSSGSITNSGTIDADVNGTLNFSILAGNAANPGLIEATNGGTVVIESSGSGTFTNFGSQIFLHLGTTGVLANDGSILVTASIGSNGGYWGMFQGGEIEVNTPMPASGILDFIDGNGDTLKLDQVATFKGAILEMGSQNVLDIGAINLGTIVYNGTSLTLENPAGTTLAILNIPSIYSDDTNAVIDSGTFAVTNNGTTPVDGLYFARAHNGDEIMATDPMPALACFAAGTHIATPDGPVAVEALRVGDQVRTMLGGKPLPIVWIGHRRVNCARHPQPSQAWPVRIAPGTFGRGQPTHPLLLSPDHAVYVDGVLIPVRYLVDDEMIVPVPCDLVTYYHIELPRHEVVFAEGLPAESYLAGADRSVFASDGGVVAMHPDVSSRIWEAEGCAELIVTGPVLQRVRDRLARASRRRGAARKQAA